MKLHTELEVSWYKQFWPWFLILLPGSVVVAGIVTVMIAMDNADSLVADNYYKDGLAINRKLELEQNARQLNINATLQIDQPTGEVRVLLRGQQLQNLASLSLQMSHPTDKQQDFSLLLQRTPQGDYLGQLQKSINGRWYIHLADKERVMWRLNSQINLQQLSQVEFGAGQGR